MAIVKSKNKKTGITYVYESESYWDPEKKQPRNHRKLIGKLDEDGNVVPTGSRGRKRKEEPAQDPVVFLFLTVCQLHLYKHLDYI